MIVTWNLQVQSGARSATWDSRTIYRSLARLSRYFAINMPQVGSGAQMPIILVPSGRWPMWTDVRNRRIYVNASFRWNTTPPGREQQSLALLHEMGHWFGGGGHLSTPGSVMFHTVGNPYQNFTQDDMRWFGRIPWKGAIRPWDEPNIWVPFGTMQSAFERTRLITLGCEPSLWDSWRVWAGGLFSGRKTMEISNAG